MEMVTHFSGLQSKHSLTLFFPLQARANYQHPSLGSDMKVGNASLQITNIITLAIYLTLLFVLMHC